MPTDSNDFRHEPGFDRHASHWWDDRGPLRTLHAINPARLDYIDRRCTLAGKQVLDLGCGGGLLCEAMASRGAQVTGADIANELIEVAREHAGRQGLTIDYIQAESSDLLQQSKRFDIIACLEMLEHVDDPGQVIADCTQLLKPGGELVLSTLNRTPRAYLFAILGAEYLTRLLPRGTHDYERFIQPAELAACCRAHGLKVQDISGLTYVPWLNRAHISRNTTINYLLHAHRDHPG